MDINRNQFFMVGVLVLLLGIQLRVVDRYELNEKATRVLAKETVEDNSIQASFLWFTDTTDASIPHKVIKPPEWSGWCLISIGSVLILHSLALKKPD